MRQISRFDFALFTICSSVCFATTVQAQQGTKVTPRQVQAQVPPNTKPLPPRPPAAGAPAPKTASVPDRKAAATAVMVDDELVPALEEILEKWEAASAKIKTIHGKQSRSEFNHTFGVEKVSRGPFYLEMPDKGRIDMLAFDIKKGAVSTKTKEGKPYSLVADQSTKWICNGEAILQLNEAKDEKTYQRVEIPEDQRGSNIVNTPLPFLLGIKAEEAKSRFQLKLFADSKDTAIIVVIPRMEKDRQNYRKAAITIDKKKYLPTQVRMIDDSNNDIVYTFEGVVVNKRELLPEYLDIWGKDPFKPNLKGYTQVVANDDPVDVPSTKIAGKDKKGTVDTSPPTSQKRILQSVPPGAGSSLPRRN